MQSFLKQHTKENLALYFQDKSYTYEWLNQHSQLTANFLHTQEIKTLAFCAFNSPVNILCYLGAWIAGVHILPINPRYTAHELIQLLKEFEPSALVIEDNRVTHELKESCEHLDIQIVTVDAQNPMEGEFWELLTNKAKALKETVIPRLNRGIHKKLNMDPPVKPQDNNFFCSDNSFLSHNETYTYHLTSGSAGHTKAVTHSLAQIIKYAQNRAEDFGYLTSDKLLVSLSVNHAFAFSSQLLPALVLGLPIYLQSKFSEAETLELVIQHKITSLALLPTMAYQLAQHAETQKVIGMTEVFGYAQNTPELNHPKASGKLFKSTRMEIRDEQNQVLPTGKTGHVFIQNEVTPLAYFKNPELSQRDLPNGWVKTGDLGYLDKDRNFYFLGRDKHIIIRGGSNIAPLEVEQTFYQHPEILEVAVIGKKDAVWGEVIWAYVVLDPQSRITESQLIEHCQTYLAEYKLPEKIIFMPELPKNATGKIDRLALKI